VMFGPFGGLSSSLDTAIYMMLELVQRRTKGAQ
jgi:hypothetical protein